MKLEYETYKNADGTLFGSGLITDIGDLRDFSMYHYLGKRPTHVNAWVIGTHLLSYVTKMSNRKVCLRIVDPLRRPVSDIPVMQLRFDIHSPKPEPAPRCTAHGNEKCPLCSRNPSTCAGDVVSGCGTYAETGMHWDTCPNRDRSPLRGTDRCANSPDRFHNSRDGVTCWYCGQPMSGKS